MLLQKPSTFPDVRCRLPGWLPLPNLPHATLLMEHLDRWHPAAFAPLRQRMAPEDLDAVAMEAFERLDDTAAAHPANTSVTPEGSEGRSSSWRPRHVASRRLGPDGRP
jgi:hypothetical protein